MRSSSVLFLCSISLIFGLGCQPPQPGPPPLQVTFRKSQIPLKGLVAGINNPSSTETIHVVAVFVQGVNEPQERSHRIDRELLPLDSITVGWAELDGWNLKVHDKFRIRCDGYLSDLDSIVSE